MGLGNAWKFPTLVGQSGGSAFILLYIILTLGVGFVIFLAELSIGKISEKDPVNAYEKLAPSNKKSLVLCRFYYDRSNFNRFFLYFSNWLDT